MVNRDVTGKSDARESAANVLLTNLESGDVRY